MRVGADHACRTWVALLGIGVAEFGARTGPRAEGTIHFDKVGSGVAWVEGPVNTLLSYSSDLTTKDTKTRRFWWQSTGVPKVMAVRVLSGTLFGRYGVFFESGICRHSAVIMGIWRPPFDSCFIRLASTSVAWMGWRQTCHTEASKKRNAFSLTDANCLPRADVAVGAFIPLGRWALSGAVRHNGRCGLRSRGVHSPSAAAAPTVTCG